MTDLPTLEAALKLADQDCPLPSLAGPALKVLREALSSAENVLFELMVDPAADGGGCAKRGNYVVSFDVQRGSGIALLARMDGSHATFVAERKLTTARTALCQAEIRAIGQRLQHDGERLQASGLTIDELVAIGRRYGMKLTPHVEAVAAEAADGKGFTSRVEVCPRCDGRGRTTAHAVPCIQCSGTGEG